MILHIVRHVQRHRRAHRQWLLKTHMLNDAFTDSPPQRMAKWPQQPLGYRRCHSESTAPPYNKSNTFLR